MVIGSVDEVERRMSAAKQVGDLRESDDAGNFRPQASTQVVLI